MINKLGISHFLIILAMLLSACRDVDPAISSEQAMFLKNPPPKSYVISPALKGQLKRDGMPLSQTKLIRKLRWNGQGDVVEQEFSTDGQGYFTLPKFEQELQLNALEQFVAKTDIVALINGTEVNVWVQSKMSKGDDAFIDTIGEMQCDLNNHLSRVNVEHNLLGTVCVWNNMPKEEDPNAL